MKTFLLIGINPKTIDYADSVGPDGFNAEKLAAAVADAEKQFADQGDRMDLCMVQPGDAAETPVTAQLARATYDCVLVGGGIREPENVRLFERIINAIHRHAPGAAIGFVTLPTDAAEAGARVLSDDYERAGLLAPHALNAA